ncbi:SRPBCC family protein [Marimonas arenosa]|uniref:SRPBCC family protein n=1 Tax=Marimonas arenosa TaxID=1795305 RepID=A0AAE3WFC0_9RHOB|nr:SRPBCC family protein [Marimonas arenosa]MDQ2091976.1 SRPBCC family protein [Marimonas arenosa]
MTDTTIRKSIFIAAGRETVWRYLTRADLLDLWFHPALADLEQGEDYTLVSQRDGERMCWGKVIEMRPPEYMRWDFTVGPVQGAMTTVEWALEEVPGGTRLTLTHSGLPEARDAFGLVVALDSGWHGFLANLRRLAATAEAGDYSATIRVPVAPEAARRAIFDQMDAWWSNRVNRSDTGVTVHFGPSRARFEFRESDRAGEYQWLCTEAHMVIEDVTDAAEWQGSRLLWHIAPDRDGSRITLTHAGLNAAMACRDVCTRGWQKYFEHSLREHLSGGTPTPETR